MSKTIVNYTFDECIEKIFNLIQDYRSGDSDFSGISKEHIIRWINQFDEIDRNFLLNELLYLLPKSYLSKNNVLRITQKSFEIYKDDLNYDSVQSFLDETRFLDCQDSDKSQKALLGIIDEILKEKYEYSISSCGSRQVKNWIYVDDVLASGGTFRTEITEKIQNYGASRFESEKVNVIASFFILHSWGQSNVKYILDDYFDHKISNQLHFYRVAEIENDPRINWYNSNPDFNHVYPVKNEYGQKYLDYLEGTSKRDYAWGKEKYAFRDKSYPKKESFYSNPTNRIRYENILLKKGIEIIQSINLVRADSLRPLGMTPPSYKTLGTGSHFFTWRNVSNTCPIVFWWGSNDWYPLFPVKNRGGARQEMSKLWV